MIDVDEVIKKLAKSKFRNNFKLKEQEINYINEKGTDKIRLHAYDFVSKRLLKKLANDGKQTPMKGHPVFIAQHATATCCRCCLYKWYKIDEDEELTNEQIDYIVDIIMAWIEKQRL